MKFVQRTIAVAVSGCLVAFSAPAEAWVVAPYSHSTSQSALILQLQALSQPANVFANEEDATKRAAVTVNRGAAFQRAGALGANSQLGMSKVALLTTLFAGSVVAVALAVHFSTVIAPVLAVVPGWGWAGIATAILIPIFTYAAWARSLIRRVLYTFSPFDMEMIKWLGGLGSSAAVLCVLWLINLSAGKFIPEFLGFLIALPTLSGILVLIGGILFRLNDRFFEFHSDPIKVLWHDFFVFESIRRFVGAREMKGSLAAAWPLFSSLVSSGISPTDAQFIIRQILIKMSIDSHASLKDILDAIRAKLPDIEIPTEMKDRLIAILLEAVRSESESESDGNDEYHEQFRSPAPLFAVSAGLAFVAGVLRFAPSVHASGNLPLALAIGAGAFGVWGIIEVVGLVFRKSHHQPSEADQKTLRDNLAVVLGQDAEISARWNPAQYTVCLAKPEDRLPKLAYARRNGNVILVHPAYAGNVRVLRHELAHLFNDTAEPPATWSQVVLDWLFWIPREIRARWDENPALEQLSAAA